MSANPAAPSHRLRIGLTGGIASGKSTAARIFSELGIAVIDADEVARRVVEPGTPGLEAVVRRFGQSVLDAHGRLNRAALRALIFAEPAARRDLEAILHPLIRSEMDQQAAAAPGPYVVLAIPLLVEGGRGDHVDRVLLIDVDESTQIARVISRDAVPESQARAILAAQATRAQRLRAADDVISNSGSVAGLRDAVINMHHRYLELARARESGSGADPPGAAG